MADRSPSDAEQGRTQLQRYGIRITLPAGDPLAKPHLLGGDWETFLWFDTAAERDLALEEMQGQHPYNRLGDIATQILERVER